ncbi:MAG TPA: primosomal protein N' [Firmicutes bacterium]|nr:primosomal protein N' [Candidatus Fermentithermobacillaceae bacterium]
MTGKVCVNVLVDVPGVGNRAYSYYLPPGTTPAKGLMVSVPFGPRKATGFILGEGLEPEGVTVKDVSALFDRRYLPPVDLIEFGEEVARYYAVPVASVWGCLWPPAVPYAKSKGAREDGSERPDRQETVSEQVTREGTIQEEAVRQWPGALSKPFIVRGTESFRFQVYLEQIQNEISRGRGVLFLLPEVRAVRKVRGKLEPLFGETIAEVHSGITDKRRREEWLCLLRGEKRLVLGTRLGVFAPVKDLSLIIVDLEEDDSYKAEDHPRYDARTLAVMRGSFQGARVIIGASRLSVNARFALASGRYSLLKDEGPRYPGEVQLIEARKYRRKGKVLSWKMADALKDCFGRKGRAFIFLNQRGYGRALFCEDCGYVPTCPRCSVALSFHSGSRSTVCHVCGYSSPVLETCPKCGGYSLKPRGFGTERLEEEFSRLFPEVPVFRVDADTARIEEPETVVGKFLSTRPACLIGTQMVLGVMTERLELVAVPFADSRLGLPGFKIEEEVFLTLSQLWDLLDEETGVFVLQAFDPFRRSIRWVVERNEDLFYEEEMEDRKSLGYPPFGVLARIEVVGKSERKVREHASRLAERLAAEAAIGLGQKDVSGEGRVAVLGPAPGLKERVRGSYHWHILLKGPDRTKVTALASKGEEIFRESGSGAKIILDVDPVRLV